ncbi:F-box/kelch-repeat protein At3g23880-like [Apium graveolens]|uniref:F-box/kelch-repeat protein At3g23880-like n=1 Tax=Apium graveolens TaxID=4045 RepID=UPI003D7B50E4
MSKFSSHNSRLVNKYRKKMRFLGFFTAQLLNRRLHKRSKKQQSGTLNSFEGSRKQQGKKKMKMTLFNDLVCNIPENKGLQIDDLSEDLLAGILVRLPVKYILRCRCVKKSWYFLVQTPMFITLQLNQQKTIVRNPNSKYLYFENLRKGLLTIHFDDVQCQEYCKIKHLPGLPKVSGAWRAVSNGLICTAILIRSNGYVDNNIYLWNPLVEKYKTLPDSPLRFSESRWNALAFGFVSEINDYVVVHVVKPLHLARGKRDPHSVFISVYSLKSNSWKALSQDKVFVCDIGYNDAVFVNGAAFWIAKGSDYRRKILCYDTKSDMLRVISLPEYNIDSRPCIPVLHSLGQSSLAYFLWSKTCNSRIYDYFSMWVLKYDSLNEFSWEKKMSIDTCEGITSIRAEVLGVRNNGEPILARSKDLVSYNLDNDEANDFVDSCVSWTPNTNYDYPWECPPQFVIHPFVETLALLNI